MFEKSALYSGAELLSPLELQPSAAAPAAVFFLPLTLLLRVRGPEGAIAASGRVLIDCLAPKGGVVMLRYGSVGDVFDADNVGIERLAPVPM